MADKSRKLKAPGLALAVSAAVIIVAGGILWQLRERAAGEAGPLAGLSAREAVALANDWAARGEAVTTYVTTETLFVKWPDGREAKVALPRDQAYVAVAPYVNSTHPCTFHYISSCRAELAGTPFKVTARTDDGRVVFEGAVTSLPNGFVELWLPRDLDLTLTVEAPGLGLAGQGRISTRSGSRTCVTDIKLDRPVGA